MEAENLTFVKQLEPGLYRLMVWVQPGAKKDQVAQLYQDRLKVRINAPPVDNKANKALIKFLAKTFWGQKDSA